MKPTPFFRRISCRAKARCLGPQYTLDVWKDAKSVHYRITNGPDGFFFRQGERTRRAGEGSSCPHPSPSQTPTPGPGVAFPTIPELIEHHQAKADGLCTLLLTIAPKVSCPSCPSLKAAGLAALLGAPPALSSSALFLALLIVSVRRPTPRPW